MIHQPSAPLVVTYPDTGNTVQVDPPDRLPVTEYQKSLGAFDRLTLRVRRECTNSEGPHVGIDELRRLGILSDAGRAFWLLFESIRETDFRENNSIGGFPVAPAEELQDNSLVATCDLECSYDGVSRDPIPLSSVPTIRITDRGWTEAGRRLSAQSKIPPHVSFALDAAYFADSDPIRAIIMACAAWETALRHYLANVASARDPAYLVASRGGNLPRLHEFMKAAKGGDLFYERYGKGGDEFYDRQRQCIRQLPTLRNKLVHEGNAATQEGAAVDAVLAVLNGIEWLFGGSLNP